MRVINKLQKITLCLIKKLLIIAIFHFSWELAKITLGKNLIRKRNDKLQVKLILILLVS